MHQPTSCAEQGGASKDVWKRSSRRALHNMQAVAACGKHWREVAKHVPRRSDKQCRERYANALNPDLRLYAEWTPEEDELLLRAVKEQTQPNGKVR